MDSRLEFVRMAEAGGVSVAELCRRFAISRQTGFQYLRRYREDSMAGLKDRSRRPHTSPRRTVAAVETQVLELRAQHPGSAIEFWPSNAGEFWPTPGPST